MKYLLLTTLFICPLSACEDIQDRVDLHTQQIQSLIDEIEFMKFQIRVLEDESDGR